MDKSPQAFRTISEVAALLETPAHVLRFWESRFPQIRPVKRAGGRRYYRPNDVALLTGIKYLLHAEGMTIRGVQKVLRDQGVRHVAGLIGAEYSDVEDDAAAALSAALSANFSAQEGQDDDIEVPQRAESATIIALETALRRPDSATLSRIPPAPETGTVDFAQADLDHGETPILPGFDLSPRRPAPLPITTLPDLIAALRTLPRHALASDQEKAVLLLHRARNLQQRLQMNVGAAGL